MSGQGKSVMSLVAVAVLAAATTGLVIQSASAESIPASPATNDSPSCWIDITGEFLLADAPLGSATPEMAIEKHEQALTATLDSASASRVPGGTDLLELRIDQLEAAELASEVGREAEFTAPTVSGEEATTVVAEQSEVDGTWRVVEESIELPVGTNCNADQLGNR